MTLDRTDLIKEYFELRTFLNRGNPQPNELTEITYLFRERKDPSTLLFFATIKGTSRTVILLCERPKVIRWRPSGHSKFQAFEEFSAITLNEIYHDQTKSDEVIHEFENWVQSLRFGEKFL
jgi:hypothetical protein